MLSIRYIVIVLIFCTSCQSVINKSARIDIRTGIDRDVRVRLLHDTDDRLVFDKDYKSGDLLLRIDSIDAGAYRLEIEWNPSVISRENARKIFSRNSDLQPNVYIKRLFINPDQDSVYRLTPINESLAQSDIDFYTQRKDLRYDLILKSNSNDAMILENFLSVIRDTSIAFEKVYERQLYKEQKKPIKGHMSYRDYLWFDLGYDKKVYEAQKNILLENIDSPVIPYILYSHGYQLSHIESFKPVVDQVMKNKKSINSIYGRLLQKQLLAERSK